MASPYNAFKVYETSAGEEEELQQLLTAQSEVESLGVVKLADPVRSIEDRRALAVMEQTTKKLEGEDAYVSGLLWPSPPNSSNMAVWRLESCCFGVKKTHRFLIAMTWLCGDLNR